MACALTQGFTLDCKEAIGGIKSVRFATLSDYLGLDPSYTTGTVSFASASQVFYKYELDKEESSFNDNPTAGSNRGTLYYMPDITFILSKLDVQSVKKCSYLQKIE